MDRLSSAFSSAILSIVSVSGNDSFGEEEDAALEECRLDGREEEDEDDVATVHMSGNGQYRCKSFYRDSSGRSRVSLDLRLDCASAEDVRALIDSGCIAPLPTKEEDGEEEEDDDVDDEDDDDDGFLRNEHTDGEEDGDDSDTKKKKNQKQKKKQQSTLRFECRADRGTLSGELGGRTSKISGPIVEAVTVVSTKTSGSSLSAFPTSSSDFSEEHTSIIFRVDVDIRAPPAPPEAAAAAAAAASSPPPPPPRLVSSASPLDMQKFTIRAYLAQKMNSSKSSAISTFEDVNLGLLALDIGGNTPGMAPPSPYSYNSPMSLLDAATSSSSHRTTAPSRIARHYHMDLLYSRPVFLSVQLVEAVTLSVTEVGGARAAEGATLVSLVVSHSNRHDGHVLLTSIALHPGHSRLHGSSPSSSSSASGLAGTSGSANTRALSSQPPPPPPMGRTPVAPRPPPPPVARMSSAPATATTMPSNAAAVASALAMAAAPLSSSSGGRSMPGGNQSVLNMSRAVRWGFVNGTAPSFPITLRPHEAVATVLHIDAGETMKSRTFLSPVAVTARVVSSRSGTRGGGVEEEKKDALADTNDTTEAKKTQKRRGRPNHLVVAADVRWTTARLPVEPSDALKIDMGIRESRCLVGAPVVVALRVTNLSNEPKDLMLLMAKDEESGKSSSSASGSTSLPNPPSSSAPPNTSTSSAGMIVGPSSGAPPPTGGPRVTYRRGSGVNRAVPDRGPPQTTASGDRHVGVNTAVVSEVNGYTFGVWGLSGDDDGTVRHKRDHELLAVDAALLLGEVKAQHSIEADLRFVPLREGTLDVPNLKLYDKVSGRWYNCVHLLKIVASAKV